MPRLYHNAMQCKNCNQQFTIYPEDKEFYSRISVPEPTLCPDCRQQRRLNFRNERSLYQRKCDLTGKQIIAIYPPTTPWPVYETKEWLSDKWDDTKFSREYDFSKNFFVQFSELQKSVPRPALTVINLENSPYVNQCWYTKDSYMCSDAGFIENCLYGNAVYHSRDVVDCLFTHNSELSYYLINCQNCFTCQFLLDCSNCHDAYFSYDCKGCSRIAFCHNLRNGQNYIFNEQVSESEFDKFLAEKKNWSREKLREKYKFWRQETIAKAIHRSHHNINAENCQGDYILNSKNCFLCYDVDKSENLKYCTRIDEKLRDAADCDNTTIAELTHECMCVTGMNLKFCTNVWEPSNDCEYCDLILGCKNCFGCIGLRKKSFCILNKQYSESEYFKLKEKIIKQMENAGEYGEFFPFSLSPYAYNETVAQDYCPMTKEQALKSGYRWKEQDKQKEQAETDTVKKCATCSRYFLLIPQEIKFYQDHALPAPDSCHNCRHIERLTFRNPRKLFKRLCSKCQAEMETTYSPERSETVYCENCYLKEIY